MKKYLIFLLLLLPLFACSKKQEGKVVATLDGDSITQQEFNAELDKIPMNMKMLVASQSGKRNFLDRLIVRKLLLKEARKEGVEKSKDFEDKLADFKEQLIIQGLVQKKIGSAPKFSDEELKAFYDNHKEEFKKEREIQTRQIVVKTEQEAREIQARIAKGEDFAELAKKYSLDPSARASGGDIGYHPKGTLLPPYEEAAFKLEKVGQVSGPVKTPLGYHVIKLEGIRPPAYVSFAEVKDFIRQRMGQEKQAEMFQKYIEDLKKGAKVTVNEDLLKEEGQGAVPAAKTESAKPDAKTDVPAKAGPDKATPPSAGAAK
jgi:peptidyl-prolyl cis-trans isomerase C